ncbi:protein ALWAYS EARLY 3-like isoform X1 [Henckelia pumila]|uniref:protein ALWAYS EARLY 3-like isoform X1 n=1 Tax=Henckelia pumila TaxID=405737 RepID=UPI003C6E860C
MLGHRWTMEEPSHFNDSDWKCVEDWRKDGDQETSNGVRSSKKTKERAVGKLQPNITFIPSEEQFVLHSQTVASGYDCLSLLRQKCSGGTQPRAVGKRTPRFPISYTHVNISRTNIISPSRPGLKINADADDEVVHEISYNFSRNAERLFSPGFSYAK